MTREFRRGERHVYRHVAGEHLLIALHRDSVAPMFSFTPTAATLWGSLEEWTSQESLIDRLCERYEVERDAAARDVSEFLAQLESIGALETRESGT
jgi:hypothetical protein